LAKVVGLGEALWDLLPGGKTLGGAPANFACSVSRLGLSACVASAVGKDALGDELLAELAKKKLDFLIETVDYPTGEVEATLNAQGIPQYEIRENSAWDNIPFTSCMRELALDCSAVCFGTLAQRCEASRATIHSFLELVPKSAYKIFDVNLRQNFYSKEIITWSLQNCDILKMNEEEVAEIARMFGLTGMQEREICLHLLETYDLKFVAETKGEAGSNVFAKGETSYLEAPKTPVADTIGAGDAWAGAFAAALLKGEPMRSAHLLAAKAAAEACARHGAM
jgi:fructokinase